MKKLLTYTTLVVAITLTSFACFQDNDGLLEELGENLNESVEEVEDEIDDATDDN